MNKRIAAMMLFAAALAVHSPMVAYAQTSDGAVANGIDILVEDDIATEDANRPGAVARDHGSLTVQGNVETGGSPRSNGVEAYNHAEVQVTGNVITNGDGSSGIDADRGSTVQIGGDVITRGDTIYQPGILIAPAHGMTVGNDTTIQVDGSVITEGNGGCGIDVWGTGSEVTVGGDVKTDHEIGIKSSGGTVTIQGNVEAGRDGIDAYQNAQVTVGGDVTAEKQAISMENTANVFVPNGTISSGQNESPLQIELANSDGRGTIVVEKIVAADHVPAIQVVDKLMYDSTGGSYWVTMGSPEELQEALPEMIVGEIETNTSDYVSYEPLGKTAEEQAVYAQEKDLYLAAILSKINYIIGVQNSSNGCIVVDGTEEKAGYRVAKSGTPLQVTLTPDAGYELHSVSGGKVTAVKNEDGTYTVTVADGGGIDISAVFTAIPVIDEGNQSEPGGGTGAGAGTNQNPEQEQDHEQEQEKEKEKEQNQSPNQGMEQTPEKDQDNNQNNDQNPAKDSDTSIDRDDDNDTEDDYATKDPEKDNLREEDLDADKFVEENPNEVSLEKESPDKESPNKENLNQVNLNEAKLNQDNQDKAKLAQEQSHTEETANQSNYDNDFSSRKELTYIELQRKLQREVKSIPRNGIYEIDMLTYVSFMKETFEAFAKRSDVEFRIHYKWRGQNCVMTIPAGTDMMQWLNEEGYCGCRYIESVLLKLDRSVMAKHSLPVKIDF